ESLDGEAGKNWLIEGGGPFRQASSNFASTVSKSATPAERAGCMERPLRIGSLLRRLRVPLLQVALDAFEDAPHGLRAAVDGGADLIEVIPFQPKLQHLAVKGFQALHHFPQLIDQSQGLQRGGFVGEDIGLNAVETVFAAKRLLGIDAALLGAMMLDLIVELVQGGGHEQPPEIAAAL